jgi:methionine-S-sulfoxide reductase
MRIAALAGLAFLLTAAACAQEESGAQAQTSPPDPDLPQGAEQAIFASGCFWCTEADFEKLDGVIEVVSGYTGGSEADPSYQDVVGGRTSHVEAARVVYDSGEVGYEALLDHYWRNVDPFDAQGQFCDRGASYAPFIFPVNEAQMALAQASLDEVQARFDREIEVEIEAAGAFWPAEAYHQDYAEKNPARYQRYRFGCRRDQRLREVWGDEARG